MSARRRDESSIAVPVTISVIGGEELQNRGITSVDAIAQFVPGLVLGSSGNALQGTASLRGIGSNESNDLGHICICCWCASSSAAPNPVVRRRAWR